MRSVLLVILMLLAAVPARAAEAAKLRPFGILDGSVVRLSDLFEDLGAAGRQVLGPGPAPGQQITVPAAQLAAIASEFGVNWRPRSPGEQAILERPGRPLRRSEAIATLRQALLSAGAPADSRVLMPDFSPPEVPPGAAVVVAVRQLEYDRASGAFSAVLSISASGMDQRDLAVSGRAERMVAILVARHVLMPGTIVTAADLRPSSAPTGSLSAEVAQTPGEATGMELRRAIAAGAPLPLADLVPPPLVRRGQRVLIVLTAPGLALTEQGRSLEAGAAGASIRVLNPLSRAVLEGRVTGPGEVRVALGSLPLSNPASRSPTSYAEYAAQ